MEKHRVKPRGLGDLVEKLTFQTGVSAVVKKAADALGIEDCGCAKRQEQLNNLFPFKQDKDGE